MRPPRQEEKAVVVPLQAGDPRVRRPADELVARLLAPAKRRRSRCRPAGHGRTTRSGSCAAHPAPASILADDASPSSSATAACRQTPAPARPRRPPPSRSEATDRGNPEPERPAARVSPAGVSSSSAASFDRTRRAEARQGSPFSLRQTMSRIPVLDDRPRPVDAVRALAVLFPIVGGFPLRGSACPCPARWSLFVSARMFAERPSPPLPERISRHLRKPPWLHRNDSSWVGPPEGSILTRRTEISGRELWFSLRIKISQRIKNMKFLHLFLRKIHNDLQPRRTFGRIRLIAYHKPGAENRFSDLYSRSEISIV